MHILAAVRTSSRAVDGVDMDFSRSGCMSQTTRAEPPGAAAAELELLVLILVLVGLLLMCGNGRASADRSARQVAGWPTPGPGDRVIASHLSHRDCPAVVGRQSDYGRSS